MTRDWLEITLTSSDDDEALVLESALKLAGALALTYRAGDTEAIYEPPPGGMPLWRQTRITGLFGKDSEPRRVLAVLRGALGADYPHEQHVLAESDWMHAWLDHCALISFGRHFWVASSAEVIDDPEAIVLRLDPGLAFGTGSHPTTAMYFVNRAPIGGKTVYDYGCGSGILGIACALRGAEHVWQTDIDTQALRAAKDNAGKNRVAEKITLCKNPDAASTVDLLVANILLELLCLLRRQFEKHLKAATELLFTGILECQVEKIRDVYTDAFSIRIADRRDSWVLLSLAQTH